jgi:hypothetical protein
MRLSIFLSFVIFFAATTAAQNNKAIHPVAATNSIPY